jgi:hypothetical protein
MDKATALTKAVNNISKKEPGVILSNDALWSDFVRILDYLTKSSEEFAGITGDFLKQVRERYQPKQQPNQEQQSFSQDAQVNQLLNTASPEKIKALLGTIADGGEDYKNYVIQHLSQ